MSHWYAIYVAGGKEEEVREGLQVHFKDALDFYIFKRVLRERKDGQWREVERKLFPGYLLVRGEIDVEIYHQMKAVQGNCRLLRSSELPLLIEEGELEVLGLLTRECEGEIGVSKVYKDGEKVMVVEGPLVGLEGLIVSVDVRKGRAKVALNFLGERRVVELGVEVVEKIETY